MNVRIKGQESASMVTARMTALLKDNRACGSLIRLSKASLVVNRNIYSTSLCHGRQSIWDFSLVIWRSVFLRGRSGCKESRPWWRARAWPLVLLLRLAGHHENGLPHGINIFKDVEQILRRLRIQRPCWPRRPRDFWRGDDKHALRPPVVLSPMEISCGTFASRWMPNSRLTLSSYSSFPLIGLRERTRGKRVLSLTDKVSSRLKSWRQSLGFSRREVEASFIWYWYLCYLGRPSPFRRLVQHG